MEEIESYYDEKSESYDDIFDMLYFKVFDVITWRYIEPYVPTDSDASVLDAGGGTGRWAIRMARKGCKVVLMDVSEEMLKIAAKKAKEERLQHKITIRKGDIARTGYADETFDMILCEHTLFLFEEPEIIIMELKRVLKRKGRLVISVHNRYVQSLVSLPDKPSSNKVDHALDVLLRKKYGAVDRQEKVKIYTWTPNEFRTMLERNGFHIEKVIGKGISMPLRISKELFMKKEYSEDLFKKIIQFELALCEKKDALSLAGHLQAIAYKP
ncbi:methyltransferase domain-containing protein [Candidatus Bathyarchaeota archaeon]|nr:methyltransferase domain-containing protein [Candidatus Bathyarchaeota archaeon]MCK4434803.1 methyltransferase domain-containing protein [Candidatus Bathyarchaeota archaeon]